MLTPTGMFTKKKNKLTFVFSDGLSLLAERSFCFSRFSWNSNHTIRKRAAPQEAVEKSACPWAKKETTTNTSFSNNLIMNKSLCWSRQFSQIKIKVPLEACLIYLQSCKTCNPVGPCGICCWMNHAQQKKVCVQDGNWSVTEPEQVCSDIILVFERRYLSRCFGSLSEESTKQTSFVLQGAEKMLKKTDD